MPEWSSPSTRVAALFDVTYFRANLTDKINGFFFDPVIGNFTAINLPGESTREGVEVSARFKLDPQPDARRRLHLSPTPATPTARARSVARRIPHAPTSPTCSTAGAARRRSPSIYNGRMEDTAFQLPFFFPSQRVGLDAYWLINATASYKLQPGVEIFGRVENLLDQHYQEVFGFESAPIAAYAGVKLTFGGTDGIGGSRRKRSRGAEPPTAQQRTTDACDGRHRSALLLLAVAAAGLRAPAVRRSRASRAAMPSPSASSRSTCAPTSSSSSWWSASASPP